MAQLPAIGVPELLPAGEKASRLALSADGHWMAAIGAEHASLLELRETPRVQQSFPVPNADSVSISPDGRWLATGTWKGYGAKVWEAASGKLLKHLETGPNVMVGFSPDGQWLLTGDGDEYRFWEMGTWKPRHAVPRDHAGDATIESRARKRRGH